MKQGLFFRVPLLLTVILSVLSCRQQEGPILDRAESLMNDMPDSAMVILDEINLDRIRSRSSRARYALLRTMAMDKTYRDITDPELMAPALHYYDRHGSADERLKMWMYQGSALYYSKDYKGAAVAFTRAESFIDKARDTHAIGLLYMSISDLYNVLHNIDKEFEYSSKGVEIFRRTDDPLYDLALGQLALVHHSRHEWNLADSLYKIGLAHAGNAPEALRIYTSNYARMKVLQPQKDPQGTIDLLNRKQNELGYPLTPKEAGAYAYAAELLGKTRIADAIVEELRRYEGLDRKDVLTWLERIAVHRSDYESAFLYKNEWQSHEVAIVQEVVNDPVSFAIISYKEQEAARSKQIWTAIIASLAGIVLALLGVGVVLWLKQRRLVRENDIATSEIERLARILSSLEGEKIGRLKQIGRVNGILWSLENHLISQKEAVEELKKGFKYVLLMKRGEAELVSFLDKELDGSISRLIRLLQIGDKPQEIVFLCLCVLDIKADIMMEILDTSRENIYEKRSRLRKRVHALGDPDFDKLPGIASR